jgi:hypothetical protein
MGSSEWYEVWRGYRHGEYVKGKGYYSTNKDTFSNNRVDSKEYPVVNRYQFREYGDLEIESCFGYPLVDRIGYFLSVLYDGGKVNKSKDMHIGLDRLHRILGEQYFERVIELLEEEGVIEIHRTPIRHSSRRKGLMFHRYALTDRMLESEVIERPIYHHMLLKNLFRYERGIDLEEELAYQHSVVGRLSFSSKVTDLDRKWIGENSKGHYHKGDRGGRVYTPWNSLKRDYRKEAILDGERLVEYDMQSAHLALLYFIQNEIKEGRKVRGLTTTENKALRKFEESTEWLSLFSEAFEGNSDFYSTIGIFVMGMGYDRDRNREQIKDAIMRDLFGRNEVRTPIMLGDREIERGVFRERVYRDALPWIESIKSNKILDEYQGGGFYINMSLILQKVEVEVMGEVWRRLRENNIDYLSIHDGICVKECNDSAVEKVLRGVESRWKGVLFTKKS